MRTMVNSIFVEGHQQAIWMIGGMVMAAFFARGVASYFVSTIMGSIGTGIVADLQKRQFDKLMTLDVAHYAGHAPGEICREDAAFGTRGARHDQPGADERLSRRADTSWRWEPSWSSRIPS